MNNPKKYLKENTFDDIEDCKKFITFYSGWYNLWKTDLLTLRHIKYNNGGMSSMERIKLILSLLNNSTYIKNYMRMIIKLEEEDGEF